MQSYSSKSFSTKNPGFIHISHDAEISDNARCLTGICSFNFCFWGKVKERWYTQVQENRVESNVPMMLCPGCLVVDNTSVVYFDKLGAPFEKTTCGTPFHCCCCIELCGQVAATAPHPMLNNPICFCLRKYQVGLKDADTFSKEMKKSYTSFKQNERSAPQFQIMD